MNSFLCLRLFYNCPLQMVQTPPGYTHCSREPCRKRQPVIHSQPCIVDKMLKSVLTSYCRTNSESPGISAVVPGRLMSSQIGCLGLTYFVCLLFCFLEHILNSYLPWILWGQLLEQRLKLVRHHQYHLFSFHRCGDSHRGSISLCLTPVLSLLRVYLVLPKTMTRDQSHS